MQIDLVDNLLQKTSMTLNYRGRSLTIDNMVIDTGAAHSFIASDIVAEIGIKFESGDKLVRSFGIGGDEYSFRKQVDHIQLDDFVLKDIGLDFNEDVNYINGLIGLDILKSGNMIIDLHRMQMYPANSK